MELKKLLESISCKTKQELEEAFDHMANVLFNQYSILKTVDKKSEAYEFAEIEFYIRNADLDDTSVHGYTEQEAGCFRFHYSGVDLTFGSNIPKETKLTAKTPLLENQYYGGILIRGLKKGDNYLLGPLRVQLELISGLSIKDGDLSLHVAKKESPSNKDLSWTTRNGISGNYSDSLLCCFDSTLANPELTKGYGEASKRFENSNNQKQCRI